jgi:phosphatidylinositol-3,4,5-trisphosphate 3-phosphatase/dual-specificity protein phosphatase PTEN
MSLDYVRGIVSGKKARYVDPDHSVDLDLVYGRYSSKAVGGNVANPQSPTVSSCKLPRFRHQTEYLTDSMGWPASGWAGTYRNRKSDVLHFLDKRHEGKYWVWNL